jgi:hypothetical protein
MTTAKDLTDQLITRAKNLKEFVVEREWEEIPAGVVRFNIQHTQGELARIFMSVDGMPLDTQVCEVYRVAILKQHWRQQQWRAKIYCTATKMSITLMYQI